MPIVGVPVPGGTIAIFAQSFEDDFKDWFADGATSTVIYVLVVLAVVAVVLTATRN